MTYSVQIRYHTSRRYVSIYHFTPVPDHFTVRANAFHLNAHSGLVRIVHFGNRAVSLEQFGVPSTFVLRSDAFEEAKKFKVKEALCYLGASAFIPIRPPIARA